MKKWVVPSEDKKGLKLHASHHCPPNAICEAPDSFTREMEPYMKLKKLRANDGRDVFAAEIDERFSQMKAEEHAAQMAANQVQSQKIVEAAEKVSEVEKFNSLNPAQRVVKNILGEFVEAAKPAAFQWAIKQIFGDKLK